MTMNRKLLLSLFMMAAATAEGAAITWSNGPNYGGTAGVNGILTNGTLVAAVDVGSAAATATVDPTGINITFTPRNILSWNIFSNFGNGGSTDATWNNIQGDANWTGTSAFLPGFLGGLIAGRTYQVQLFSNDIRLPG